MTSSEWSECFKQLQAGTSTGRKEGAKQALSLLDADKVGALDAATRRHPNSLKGTWAGLADAIATYVGSELVSNKGRKTALANTVSSLFRKCIRKAEESARVAALGHPLLPSAPALFEHVLKAMAESTATAQLTTDYTTTLRELLLPVPAYCLAVSEETFFDLARLFMNRLRARDRDNFTPEEVQRMAAAFAELLRRCPHDLNRDCWEACLDFFVELCESDDGGESALAPTGATDARTLSNLFAALNVFLLKWGADVAHDASTLSLVGLLAPILLRAWSAQHVTRKIKDECFAVARTLLNIELLGKMPGLLQATLDAAITEVELRAADSGRLRGDGQEPKGPSLGEEARLLMELISDLWAHRTNDGLGWHSEPNADADDVAMPRKRARTMNPWTGMVVSVCNSQLVLLPALALALRRHGETVPQHLLSATFQPLWACLRSSVHADRAACTPSEALCAIWAIRCLRLLASLSSKHTAALSLAADGDMGTPAETPGADAAYSWPEVAEHLRAWMATPGAGAQGDAALLMSESIQLWSELIVHALTPPPRVPELLLRIKHVSEVSALSLLAVAAFFSRPSGGFAGTLSEPEHRARQRGVAWALQALAPPQPELIAMTGPRQVEEPPNVRGVADVLRALCLGLCPNQNAVAAAATHWWQDDAKELSRRLIRRGVAPTAGHTISPAGSAIPPTQCSRLALPVTKELLTLAGQALASALDGAQEAAHIFALMAVAAEFGTAAAAAVFPEPPPQVWCTAGAVALSSASALDRAQGVLMERTAPVRLFTPRLLAAASALGAAAALEPISPLAPVDSLGETVLQLRHALLAAATALQASVTAEPTTAARVEDDLFFDDGDFGQVAGTTNARSTAGTQRAGATAVDPLTQMATAAPTGSALAASGDPLETCIGVMAALGVARPAAAAEALISLLDDMPECLPQSAHDAVLTALCGLHGAPSRALSAAMVALSGELQQVQSHQYERVGWLLHLLALAASVQLDFRDQSDTEMPDADADASLHKPLHTAYTELCDALAASQSVLRACGVTAGVALVHSTFDLVAAVRDAPDCIADVAGRVMVEDQRYAVRVALVSRFGELMSSFAEKNHQLIMRDVSRSLAGLRSPAIIGICDPSEAISRLPDVEIDDKARQETTLLLLGEAAVASGPMEAACVYDIISLAVDQPCHTPMALRVLTATANRMGYADRFPLIEHHIAFIAHQWTVSGRNVDSLVHAAELLAPRQQLTKGSDIVRSYARFMLPRLVECNDTSSVSRVAELCGLSNRELFLQHGARTLAALHAFRINGGEGGKQHFRSALENEAAVIKLAFKDVMEMFKNKWPLILRELLRMVPPFLVDDAQPGTPGSAHTPELLSFQPSMSMAATLAAVYDVEASLNRSTRADAQTALWTPAIVAEHLVFIHGIMDRAKSARHRVVALNALSVLLQVIEKHRKFDEPSTFHYAMHLLLNFATAPSLQHLAVSLLDRLVLYALAVNSAGTPMAQMLGNMLWRVVSRLVACAQAEAAAPAAGVMRLLRKLVLEAPRWLLPKVTELDPFPDAACFDELRNAHEALSRDTPLPGRLSRFCERARSMQPGARRLTAQSLLAALRAPGAVARASTEAALITPAVWQLARLCEEADDDALRELAAAALALVGSPDPFAIAFHSTTVATPAAAKPSRAVGASAEDVALARLALRALAEYLVDPDHCIVNDALKACKALLSTPAGTQALNDMASSERIYIAHLSAGGPRTVDADDSAAHAVRLEDDSLWSPPAPGPQYSRRYDAWLCKLAHALLSHARGGTLRLCHSLVGRKAELAALLLPYAFADIADGAGAGDAGAALQQLLSRQVEQKVLRNPAAGARATHALLECLTFLRNAYVQAGCTHGMPSNPEHRGGLTAAELGPGPTSWTTVHWLNIDYLCVARAALSCGACFTALQYVEYWCEDAYGKLELGSVDSLNDAGPLPAHIAIALEAHAMCGETDGIYGLLRAPHVTLQLRRAEHEGAWDRSLAAHDAVLSVGGSGATSAVAAAGGVLRSIQHIGCYYVLDAVASKLCQKTGDACSPEFREAQMQAAWRAGRWADADGSVAELAQQQGSDGFHACFTSALLATSAGEVLKCSAALSRGRASVMRGIALTGAESAASINTAIVRLQLLDEVSDVANERWGTPAAAAASSLGDVVTTDLTRRWDSIHTAQHGGRFDLLEPLLAGRSALFNAVGSASGSVRSLTAVAAAARAAGLASAGLARIHAIKIACAAGSAAGGSAAAASASVGAADAPWRDEEAALLWMDGQHQLALGLAKALVGVVHSGRGGDTVKRTAALLSCLGGWLAERHAESTECIRSQHLEKAVKLLSQAKATRPGDAGAVFDDDLCHAQFQLAQFLDSIHRGFEERVTSADWSRGQQLLESTRAELAHRTNQLREEKAKSVPRDAAGKDTRAKKEKALTRRITSLQREVNTDEPKRALIKAQHEDALIGCLTAYGGCLSSGDSHDMTALFRLVALWFKSAHNQGVNELLSSILVTGRHGSGGSVPSAKMLPLVWQLVARLEKERDAAGFQQTLHAVVGRVARDHPFHSLYQLLALRAANVVGQEQLVTAPTSKIAAAAELLDGVRASDPRLATVLSQMETLVGAYVKITELERPADKSAHNMPLPGDLRRLPTLDMIPIITAHLPVDPSCEYPIGSFPTLHKLPAVASLPGGVNAPRKLDVLASDGKAYSQLAKGKDDLRQDAVMQQVFGHASALLRTAPGARARGMRMHTYKVIPFNPTAGLVEWCNNTRPLSDYLVRGKGSAHRRLRPDDITSDVARTEMEVEPPTFTNLRNAFDGVCDRFKPVMHHFFLESFHAPSQWYERRLAYTRSVAVSSMVGYIIGLGDRHSSNILIGNQTGELVHIDLGIAFDQGELLPTPETVPFRLTRDIVDGCGAAGVEGVLRRCCEESLSVLRANKESLVTLIEVLIHDPILKWAMSPELARRHQGKQQDVDADEEDELLPVDYGSQRVQNADAERALLRVRQKLDGVDDGQPRPVEAQVQQLLQTARDPDKLCRLFPGWAAWV